MADEPAIKRAIEEALERAESEGITVEDMSERASEAVTTGLNHAIDEISHSLAKRLRQTQARMIADHERMRRSFEHRLRWVWGETLDLLYAIIVACEEAGDEFNSTHRPAAAQEQDHRFEALTLIHARACHTALEVHTLLRAGHPFGARARWRTLHELSVIASILGDGDDDLANRFLVHSEVEAYKDALLHNEMSTRTRRPPHPAEELERLGGIYHAAVLQFGKGFTRDWGWAAPVTAPQGPNFRLLEKQSGLDHLRPDYRTSSHLVHAGSSGADFVRRPFRGGHVLLTGSTNEGLAEPAHGAAISLVQITNTLVVRARPFIYSPVVVSMLQAFLIMIDELGELAVQAADRVEELEEAMQEAETRGRLAVFLLIWRRRRQRMLWRLQTVGRRIRTRTPKGKGAGHLGKSGSNGSSR